MKRKVLLLGVMMLGTFLAKADYNPANNGSAKKMKTGNRNASITTDAPFYNPAGTVWGSNGFTVEFSTIPFYSTKKITDNGNLLGTDMTYNSKTSSLFYPALNLTYKKDKFAAFMFLGITNGGGAGNYDDGLPMFERLGYANVMAGIMGGLLPGAATDYAVKTSFNGSAYGLGGWLGAAYKVSDMISVAGAIQYSHQSNHQEGWLDVSYIPAPGAVPIPRTEIDVDFTGQSFGFIGSLDIKPLPNLLIANTFRYFTEMELETKVNDGKDGDGMFVDGTKSLSTYVPTYNLGIAYEVNEKLKLAYNMNVSFYSMLDLDKDANDVDIADYYKNGIDFGLAAEYQINEKVNWGLGFTYAPYKMKKEYQSEMEFETTTLWFNTGASVMLKDNLGVDLGFQVGIPTEKRKIDDTFLAPFTQTLKNELSYSMGIGFWYKF
ncbi:OmpP1/FadL family transporter [Tenuifilum thalassicum]|uniref:Aromatic hydrocarbon degradation protein n=1 Tax=Tenuifilum thalassicum TaxID=2590900 RepID=A0A7D3XWU2_9BACT|nr:outer membrane protein transport protein [Tenuifilum thalassicum]QKG80948.1 hypothetical protein FHG85_11970 [Tenuifilum thalassicum]